jgi:hypothetical protein
LEDRIAELENYLSSLGYESVGDDHWKQKQNQFHDDSQTQDDQQEEEIDILLGEVRELASSGDSKFVGRKISLGRVLGSVIKTQKSPKSDLNEEENTPKLIDRSELVEKMGPMFVSPVVADRLLDGWVKHLSTRYPAIHTPRLRELHARRNEALDIFEESILHLVYANSGWIMETVCVSQVSRISKVDTLQDR